MLSEHEEAELAHARRISFGPGMHGDEEEDTYTGMHQEADDDFLGSSRMEENNTRNSDRGSDDEDRQRAFYDHERYDHRRRHNKVSDRQQDDDGLVLGNIGEGSSNDGSMRRQRRGHGRHSDSRSPPRSENPSPRLLAQAANLGIGMGQLMGGMGPVRNHFDFGPMEEFAGKEKESLAQGMSGMYDRWNGLEDDLDVGHAQDIGIPTAEQQTSLLEGDLLATGGGPSSYDSNGGRVVGGTTIGDADSQTGSSPPPKTEDLHVEPENTFTRRRQRKLSNTNATARRQGRLALFEGLGGGLNDDSVRGESYTVDVHNHDPLNGFSSALPTKAPRKPFPAIASGIQSGKYTDYPDALGPPVGRERPYRFSFYSNALPATIHARSLSELPSEGQTFGDLFAGRPAGKGNDKNGSDGASFAASRTGSGAATPVTETGPKASMLARAAAHAADRPQPKPVEDDVETKTWWLDVLSPTDEEMRMLAKVSLISLDTSSSANPDPIGLRHSSVDDRRHPARGNAREDRTLPQLLSRLFPIVRPGPVQPNVPRAA